MTTTNSEIQLVHRSSHVYCLLWQSGAMLIFSVQYFHSIFPIIEHVSGLSMANDRSPWTRVKSYDLCSRSPTIRQLFSSRTLPNVRRTPREYTRVCTNPCGVRRKLANGSPKISSSPVTVKYSANEFARSSSQTRLPGIRRYAISFYTWYSVGLVLLTLYFNRISLSYFFFLFFFYQNYK